MNRVDLVAAVAALALALAAGQAAAHGDEDHGQDRTPADAALSQGTAPKRLPDGSLFVPKTVQHQLGLRTRVMEIADQAATVEINGKVIADPNAGGRVQSIQPGRIDPGPQGLPTLGQTVVKGQVLAYLQPASNSIDRGNQQAQLAELESQFSIGERNLKRLDQLAGAVPKKEVEAARFELGALKKRRAAVDASLSTPEPLLAPVSGVIGAANVVAGQVVETKEILFEVVDPAHLAVEALAYDATLVEGIGSASAPVPGGALELQFVGGGRQLREQAIPLLFRVTSASAPVAVGQPLRVIVKTTRTAKGAAVPQAALVRNGAGDWVLWVHAEAEHFVPRQVRFASLDATTALVTSGIAGGERVVTDGAGLLAQVR
jgi:hypothetical protein